MSHQDPDIRYRAAQRLSGIKSVINESDVPIHVWIRALKDSDEYIRSVAATALDQFKSDIATEVLMSALNDANAEVQKNVSWALWNRGFNQGREVLLQLIETSDVEVRKSIIRDVEKLHLDDDDVSFLVRLLDDDDDDDEIHVEVLESLIRIGTVEYVNAFINIVTHPNRSVRSCIGLVLDLAKKRHKG